MTCPLPRAPPSSRSSPPTGLSQLWVNSLLDGVLNLANKVQASNKSSRATLGIPTDLDPTLNGLNPFVYVLDDSLGIGKDSLALNLIIKATEV